MHKCFLSAGISFLLLAGCSAEVSEDRTNKALAESDSLRKNGNALIKKGDLPEAVAVFDKLINMDPQNYLAYNGKAVAFDYGGNHLAAQDLYQTALSLSPDYLPIKNNLAMSLLLNDQIEQAIILLESLLPIKTDNPHSSDVVRHNLALAYGISGQREKANKLNLQDLTEAQARENLRYYEHYITHNTVKKKKGGKARKDGAMNYNNIGFITSSPLKLTIRQLAPNKDNAPVSALGAVSYQYPK